MARTKASVGAKMSSGKSSKARCSVAPPAASAVSGGSSDRSAKGGSGGGNPVCPRETPKWQKPITNFFICKDKPDESDNDDSSEQVEASSSKSKPKRHNVIESDDENEQVVPTNNALDETLELEPLIGEDSHKIEEYYSKNNKGKGKGKKTKDKENMDCNVERRSSKRDLEDDSLSEEATNANKKIKV